MAIGRRTAAKQASVPRALEKKSLEFKEDFEIKPLTCDIQKLFEQASCSREGEVCSFLGSV